MEAGQAEMSRRVASLVAIGWRVESETPDRVVVVKGHRPNHLLHLILSIVTLGFWLIVWAVIAITVKERRMVLMVDPATGAVQATG